MTCNPDQGVLAQMHALSSAEEIFAFLSVPYDQAVLNRTRLHIMKRMGDYLARVDLSGLDDDGILGEARKALTQAHADFENSTPRAQKALKVFAQPRGNVVPVEGIRLATR
ncbi:nitrogenase-stabilizing/protective protein NifW [Rhodovulum euryhalinum]|uniref:Nitrogenase-stabilizing/protective protein NifW n=1 Tax=Rhodovulum euryhalinum TaxID=35805 RepID=A0A4R2KE03_9RHOB|nr:nitrogenase-stabilizing/protective protein NifW [Rhodovulum euryhalinum]TCO71204.1 nitrogenase-stabilizing/protective protein [Rhodovulum euryhalinum]